ncbi:MAG: class I SAM-dependent methyltransferase [Nitrospirae bacterium]|nr:class I SAM-dependent methyltransferase [Nitrospirota bacterium]
METVSCDLCGSFDCQPYLRARDHINRIEGIFSVVQCRACGLIYTNPRPNRTEMSAFYPASTSYYVFTEKDLEPMKVLSGSYRSMLQYFRGYPGAKKSSPFRRALLLPYYLIKRHKFAIEAIPDYVPNGALLEIGSSYGKFLHGMKSMGWNVQGIEMSSEAAAACKKVFDIDLICQDLDSVSFEENSFDVVVMRMVLEHVFSPAEALRKINRWLKPSGRLILVLPDISGAEARLFRGFFYGLHLPNHVYHFSPRTISKYLVTYGFTLQGILHHRTDRDFIKSLDNALDEKKRLSWLKYLTKGIFKPFFKWLICILSAAGRTSRMTVIASKKEI